LIIFIKNSGGSIMSIITKHTTLEKGLGPVIFSNNVKSHSNDPLVIQKAEKAKETLKKAGLPDIKKK